MAFGGQQAFDLNAVVKEWAWNEYSNTENWKQKRLRKKEEKYPEQYLLMQIDWSRVKFTDCTHWPPRLTQTGTEQTKQLKTQCDTRQLAERPRLLNSLLFETIYTNNTNEDQTYTIQTSKETRSECSTSLGQSWTRGMHMGISLKTPGEILEANVGFSRELSLTDSCGQVFEHTMSWAVDSEIKVKAGHVAKASLVVAEEHYSGNFQVETKLQGRVRVTFTDPRDNNALIKAITNNIDRVIKWHQDRRGKNATIFVKVDNGIATIVTTGKCNFRFGVRQEVKVDQITIADYEKSLV